MSCGQPTRNNRLSLRLEVARMVLAATPNDFDTMFPKVITAVGSGVDLDALDAPPLPVAIGDGPEAVTSRNAMINSPLSRIFGLPPKVVARLQVAGIGVLGALVQSSGSDLVSRGVGLDEIKQLQDGLERYGLGLAMSRDQLHDWVIKGAH